VIDLLGAILRGRDGVRVCGRRVCGRRRRRVRPRWWWRRGRGRERVATWTVLSMRWRGGGADSPIGAAARLIVEGHGQIVSATDQDQDQRCLPHCGEACRRRPDAAIARPRYTARSFTAGAGSELGIANVTRP
jgi:hypothetical protein